MNFGTPSKATKIVLMQNNCELFMANEVLGSKDQNTGNIQEDSVCAFLND